jgi:small neutral amino acid transporter SnatA (MarC family)
MSPAVRRRIAAEGCPVAFGALAGSVLIGGRLLGRLGISLAAFRIAAFPLGIPLMAGPGAITARLLLAGRMNANPRGLALLILIAVAMVLFAYLVFLAAGRLERILGASGQAVFARLLGVLLAALAVQYVVDEILDLRG